ncbi:MAG: ATP-dependent sacrificial sulfur transferase LarE [Thermodesulfobacteriota bacterium]
MKPALLKKYEALRFILNNIGKVAVAFSGGVDSTLLLKIARITLGNNVLAVYGSSVLQKEVNRQMVRFQADEIGARLFIKEYFPLSWPEFVVNSEDRCYYCKRRIYSGFLEIIPPGYSLLDASQLDDFSRERPGIKAIHELGVKTPLFEASLNKKEVRCMSRAMQLSNWLSPSESCLATRIKTGKPITERGLKIIARGEEFLEGLGFSGCRVKFEEDRIFISLLDDDYLRLGDPALRYKIEDFFRSLACRRVFLVLSGRPNY